MSTNKSTNSNQFDHEQNSVREESQADKALHTNDKDSVVGGSTSRHTQNERPIIRNS